MHMKSAVEAGENPMVSKRRLAKDIVTMLASAELAEEAAAHFTAVHQKGEKPEEIPEFALSNSPSTKLLDVMQAVGMVASKSEAKRQIEQGGVKVDDVVVTDITMDVQVGNLIQKGKRHFVQLV